MSLTARTNVSNLRYEILLRKLDHDFAGYGKRQSNQKLVEVDTMELFVSIAVINRTLGSLAAGKV